MPDPCELIWPGKHEALARPVGSLRHVRTHGGAGLSANRLFQGDNVPVMQALLGEFGGRVDLIYLDPPFNTGQRRRSGSSAATYTDSWSGAAAYLRMLHPRMRLCRDLLGPTGSLILHLDWRSVHLARCVLDELFGRGEADSPGEPGFRNEIIWGYGGGGRARNAYRRKHDTLLWYSRSDRWTFNPQYRPYTPGTLQRGLTAVKGPNYTLRPEGAALETWWTDAAVGKVLSPTAAENRGYPTQKPENLLERILIGHSQPGDLVADFFCGSGTTGAVAQCS